MGWGNILASAVNGYMAGQSIAKKSANDEADTAWKKTLREHQTKEWAESDSLKSDLKGAAAPVSVAEGSGGAVLPETMDNRDVGQPGEAPIASNGAFRVGASTFADPNAAQAAAAAQNDPSAVAGRQAAIYAARGMPTEAATLENRQADIQKKAEDLKQKGVFSALQRFRAGDKDAAVKGLKSSGFFNIADGEVTMTPTETDMPGVGKIKTYDLTFNQKNADGTVSPFTVNSHVASLAMMPYEKQLELQRKGTDSENKADFAQQRIDLAGQLAEARIARMQALSAGGGGGGGGAEKADREYRLLLQNNAGAVSKDIREVDAQIKDLQANAIPGKVDPRLVDLVKERSQHVARRDALNSELLDLTSRSAGAKGANTSTNLAQAAKTKTEATPYGKLPKIGTKADYDKLKSGDGYIAPDGSIKRKG